MESTCMVMPDSSMSGSRYFSKSGYLDAICEVTAGLFHCGIPALFVHSVFSWAIS